MKRSSLSSLLLSLLLLGGLAACKEATLEPELFGGIQGGVYDFETKAPLGGASITTSPPSGALVSDGSGRFSIEVMPVGNYTITASLPGYRTNAVTISVRENQTTQANVFLERQAEKTDSVALAVEVLNWASRVSASGDSAFVDVEYRVRNTGTLTIRNYEVYFRIATAAESFYQEQVGDSLKMGQADIRRFEKYTRRLPAQEVAIDGFWFPQPL